MTGLNRNAHWARALVGELVAAGVDAACVAPGNRPTPLTVAVDEHAEVEVFSHLDERSAGFFALGRGRRTGRPTPVVCPSGTAAANVHPAVMEADESRVPLLVLTADRPPELQDSGANRTVDQTDLYGDAVRYDRTLPEPEPADRKLRALRVTVHRAVAEAGETPAGPVHLNVPLRKPVEPVDISGEVSDDFAMEAPLAADGRVGPYVETAAGRPELRRTDLDAVIAAVENATRGLIVCGPADPAAPAGDALDRLTDVTGFPVLADPLSGHRFGPHVDTGTVCGGYDSYLDGEGWPEPDVVFRFGGSPTSETLRHYLRDADARQILVDPAGGWREAEFTATDLLAADPTRLVESLAAEVTSGGDPAWRRQFEAVEAEYWSLVDEACESSHFEGAVLYEVTRRCPDSSTLFVSSGGPVGDLDRFGQPRSGAITALGNCGVDGIDGVTSTALGAGSATEDPLVLVTGDPAYYHDMNGLLALGGCDIDATIVLLDTDSGCLCHGRSSEQFEPPFTGSFATVDGFDFEPTGDLYALDFERVESLESFVARFERAFDSAGTQVIDVRTDAETGVAVREQLHERVSERLP